jgi:DNA-binding NarL/FixJ family response regulator
VSALAALRALAPAELPAETPTEKVTVFLVDDHDVVREGLLSILGREPDIEVVGESSTAEGALESLDRTNPSVVVVDYRLPGMDGIELCREIAERRLRAQVVMLSAYLDDDIVYSALMSGARAYVVKDVESSELKRAIRAAARGETVIDPKVAGRILNWAARLDPRATHALRPMELRVMRLLVEGRPNREIARLMGLSPHTVKSYLREIYRKLEVGNRAEAAAVALRRGLV